MFTIAFLAMRYDSMFAKTSRIVKGLALFHILLACYVMSLGAGASMNPAFGMAQTTYWVALAKANDQEFDATCIWVYMTMPFVGAIIAASVFEWHRGISEVFTPAEIKNPVKDESEEDAALLPPKNQNAPENSQALLLEDLRQ